MVLSCSQLEGIMKHILEEVLFQKDDSKIHHALKENDIESPFDLCALEDDEIAQLQYHDDNKILCDLLKGNIGLLKAFKSFVAYQELNGSPIQDTDWLNITKEQFNKYRISNTYTLKLTPIPVQPTSCPLMAQIDPVRDFQRSIKRDIALFIPLKDDAAWDYWKHITTAQARTQGVEEVLEPMYVPKTADEISLFDEKQKYMYAVFEKTLLADKGKA